MLDVGLQVKPSELKFLILGHSHQNLFHFPIRLNDASLHESITVTILLNVVRHCIPGHLRPMRLTKKVTELLAERNGDFKCFGRIYRRV